MIFFETPQEKLAFDSGYRERDKEINRLENEIASLKQKLDHAECVAIVKVDEEILKMCIEMYQSGDKITAIKWLLEHMNQERRKITWAKEFFENLGLDPIKEPQPNKVCSCGDNSACIKEENGFGDWIDYCCKCKTARE